MKIKPLLVGLASHLPPARRYIWNRTGGSTSARYCYSIWLRHLVLLGQQGLPTWYPRVGELGPGDSLGIGLAALLTATDHYCGLDVVKYASSELNLRIFDELVELLTTRADIPGEEEFPFTLPRLTDYSFPSSILTPERLEQTLEPTRLALLRQGLREGELTTESLSLKYVSPWFNREVIEHSSLDLIFSQAVLEHVRDLEGTIRHLASWLKHGGVMSHVIGFNSHGITDTWNGHLAIPGPLWKLIEGKRPYLINRQPLSEHLRLLEDAGFSQVRTVRERFPSGIPRKALAREFRKISDQDLTTHAAFIQSIFPLFTAR